MVKINGVRFNKPTQEQVDWLKANYAMKLADLERHMGLSDETITRMLKALGIERKRLWKVYLPFTPEVDAELRNPYLSHVKIASKYGVHESTVAARRRNMGIRVRRCVGSTRIEDRVEEMLKDLDLAYVPQKRVGRWSIDFYLGRGYCIDVHGTWAHQLPLVLERDVRKRRDLEAMGFKYLVLHEARLDDAVELIEDFVSGFPPAATRVQKTG